MPERRAITAVLVALSILFIGYNGPYLWHTLYRHINAALANPIDEEHTQHEVEDTAKTYQPYCFSNIKHRINDWNEQRGMIPAGDIQSRYGTIRCVVTWKPGTELKDVQSLPQVAGFLYHPGFGERTSLSELGGDKYPVAILRVGSLEQRREFKGSRGGFRWLIMIAIGVFVIAGIARLLSPRSPRPSNRAPIQ